MARKTGLIKIKGTLDNVSFYKSKDKIFLNVWLINILNYLSLLFDWKIAKPKPNPKSKVIKPAKYGIISVIFCFINTINRVNN